MLNLQGLSPLSRIAYGDRVIPKIHPGYYEWHSISPGVGLQASVYINEASRTAIVAFRGADEIVDFVSDAQLAALVQPLQSVATTAYVGSLRYNGVSLFDQFDVTFTGHSLGGYLAQQALNEFYANPANRNAKVNATVFNSTGYPSAFWFPQAGPAIDGKLTCVYSNPESWSALDRAIHQLHDWRSNEVYFALDARGHGMASLNTAVSGGARLVSVNDDVDQVVGAACSGPGPLPPRQQVALGWLFNSLGQLPDLGRSFALIRAAASCRERRCSWATARCGPSRPSGRAMSSRRSMARRTAAAGRWRICNFEVEKLHTYGAGARWVNA